MLTIDRAAAVMRGAKETGSFTASPKAHCRQIGSSNPLERLGKELKRRFWVDRIYPNEDAATRLAGAVLIGSEPYPAA